MKKYKTTSWSDNIEEVEIIRETDNSVFRVEYEGREKRSLKTTSYNIYHNTWSAAHGHLVDKTQKEINSLRSRLARKEKELERLAEMGEQRVRREA